MSHEKTKTEKCQSVVYVCAVKFFSLARVSPCTKGTHAARTSSYLASGLTTLTTLAYRPAHRAARTIALVPLLALDLDVCGCRVKGVWGGRGGE